MTKTPHKHAEVIKLWADGEAIEYRANDGEKWTECENPAFVDDYYYRVKPARSYPVTALTPKELDQAWGEIFRKMRSVSYDYTDFANLILRHAIDNGQVVTREEFALAIGDRDKRDMKVAKSMVMYVGHVYGLAASLFSDEDLRDVISKATNV